MLWRYGATNARLFASVARGDATASSDIDLMVALGAAGGNPLMRVAGIGEELSQILGVRVDVVTDELLRDAVSATALADAVPL
ncbi:nucleotidyltransferase domain-containing protein [Salinibacterium sp.]|uniref:nucleotidyltransferase family protein n=1 Tax=Salinibacterium sp. TaxID=1915057 RepID=UPI00286AB8D1|nr:nucleotidyltransferase domain-containing protein [Salinibacterium sp.]